MRVIKKVPPVELLYWVLSAAAIVSGWVFRERISAKAGSLSFIMLFALLCIGMGSMAEKSGFSALVDAVRGKYRPLNPVSYSNIYLVFEGIESGSITVTEEVLNMLESLRRSMYYGVVVLMLCFLTNAAISLASE